VTKHFATKQLRFYLTNPAPCPYLPGQRERKVFTSLDTFDPHGLNEALTHAGFRRSQNIAYRPACEACDACISARIPVARFQESRRWRRVLSRNRDLEARLRPAEATEEQYWLARRYLNARHTFGGMAEMALLDYAAMVEETVVRTHMIEYRYREGDQAGELAGAALVDLLQDGLSLVYSYFEPCEPSRSMGSFIILDHVRQARALGLPYVYLGYWVPGSAKMGYKAEFQPLELLRAGGWLPFETAMRRAPR